MQEVFRVIRKSTYSGYEQVLDIVDSKEKAQPHIDEAKGIDGYYIIVETFIMK